MLKRIVLKRTFWGIARRVYGASAEVWAVSVLLLEEGATAFDKDQIGGGIAKDAQPGEGEVGVECLLLDVVGDGVPVRYVESEEDIAEIENDTVEAWKTRRIIIGELAARGQNTPKDTERGKENSGKTEKE